MVTLIIDDHYKWIRKLVSIETIENHMYKYNILHSGVMSFPIKSHLPVITTRVEFEFNKLPPPPQITICHDFGAHIWCRAQHNSKPYNWTRGQSIRLGFQSNSLLSDLSETEESIDGDNNQPPLIPKPRGEAEKANSGSYSLKNTLGWTERQYEEFDVSFKVLW